MDKLPEPHFEEDKKWPRMRVGVEEYIKNKESKFPYYFAALATASIFRYYREVFFYKKNSAFFFAVVIPTFAFTSYQLANFFVHDSHAHAARENNKKELEFRNELRAKWREAKKRNVKLSDDITLMI